VHQHIVSVGVAQRTANKNQWEKSLCLQIWVFKKQLKLDTKMILLEPSAMITWCLTDIKLLSD
jgi:hypothetical protein